MQPDFKTKTVNHQEKIMNLINLIDHCHNVFKTKKQIDEAKRCIVYYVYSQILLIYKELLQREKLMKDTKEDLFEQEEETKILNNIQNILAVIIKLKLIMDPYLKHQNLIKIPKNCFIT